METSLLYKAPSTILITWFAEVTQLQKTLKLNDGNQLNLFYYHTLGIKRIEIKQSAQNLRQTFAYLELSTEVNKKKTERSLRANLIHAVDAYFARAIQSQLSYEIVTIHDCFAIDILNVDSLIRAANIAMSENNIVLGYEEVFQFQVEQDSDMALLILL